MARMSDYESVIFDNKNKIFDLEKRVDSLENENMRLKTLLNDKLIDIQMDINILKQSNRGGFKSE